MPHEARIDSPLAGATVALLGGQAATVAAWWCGSMGADVVVAEPDEGGSGAFHRAIGSAFWTSRGRGPDRSPRPCSPTWAQK